MRLRNLRNASILLSMSGTCTGVEILGVHLRTLRNASTYLSIYRRYTGMVNVRVTKRTLRYASMNLLSISGNNASRQHFGQSGTSVYMCMVVARSIFGS